MDLIIVYFLKYLLAPLIAIVALVILNNVIKVKKLFNVKKAIILLLVITLLLLLPVTLSFLKYEFIWIGLVLTVFSYIILGILFIFFKNTKLYKSIGLDNKFHTLFFLFVVLILSGWLYYLLFEKISGLSYGVWAMFSVIWFVVPTFYTITLDYFLSIAKPFYKSWSVSNEGLNNSYWDNVDVFKLIQVTVKIKRSPEDSDYTSLSVKLPLEVPIGVWFNRFIEDQNFRFPNQMINPSINGEPIGWIFYTNRWFNFPLFTRVLDAEMNGTENNIRNKQTIYIRRTRLNTDETN